MSLVNPGMLTEYEGPSRSSSRRSRGTVRVRDPAHGFFIAGSSLPALNGIYGRVRNEHVQFLSGVGRHRPVRLAYRHDQTGWLMALVDISEEERPESDEEDDDVRYGFKEPCDMQWRFIDDKGLHRFRHKGDTIIPGAGIRWKHLPLPKPPKVGSGSSSAPAKSDDYVSSDSDSDSDNDAYYDANSGEEDDDQKKVAASDDGKSDGLEDVPLGGGDGNDDTKDSPNNDEGAIVAVDDDDTEEHDEDQLPWQVIALLDRSVLEDLRFSSACRDEKVDRALKGLDVQQPCQSTTVEGFLEAERRVLRSIESGVVSFGTDEDGNDGDENVTPKGWLYRVTAEDGVQLFTAPPDGICVNESDEEEEGVVADVDMDEDSDDGDDSGNDGPRIVGMRYKHDYVRVIEQKGNWLCLARHEPPLRDVPLQVGDKVKVISGHYKGETGEITEEASKDTKEFGVNLMGYNGTGKLHAACMVRNGPHPLSRAAVVATRKKKTVDAMLRREERRRKREAREREREIMRAYYGDAYNNDVEGTSSEESDGDDDEDDPTDGNIPDYDDGYKGKLWVNWVKIADESGDEADGADDEALLIRIPEHSIASLHIGSESCHAELYDKPFEPRIESGSTHSVSSSIDGEDGVDDLDDDKEDVTVASSGTVLLRSGGSVENAEVSPQCTESSSLTVGLPVSLCGLKGHARYNGRTGVIITSENRDGRIGVRLDPSLNSSIEECDKKLLLLLKNITPISKQSSALDLSDHMTSEEQEHASRAARVLNVHVDAIGLGNSRVEAEEGKKLLDLFLRSAEREAQPHRPRVLNASAQQLQNESLREARKAHSALSIGIDKVSEARNNESETGVVGASPLSLSPTAIIEAGLLGERAKAALALAAESNNFDDIEKCLSTFRGVLKDEQGRIVRARAGSGLVSSTILDWKLEQAEKDAANDAMDSIESNDCLLIRVAITSVLFDATRLSEASTAAKGMADIYPTSGASQLWLGRCLISEGMRIEGIQAINKCVTVGPHSGPGGNWAHREGVRRLRSMKRTLKCEIRARDSYERGKFKEAVNIYGEMMTEYNDGYARDDKWGQCEALVARAACHRRDRDLKAALADCDAALVLYPRYPRALFRRALCLLEDQCPTEALAAFEQLLRVDRNWPNLLDWLIRATAQAKRQGTGGAGGGSGVFQGEGDAIAENKDYYAVLSVSTDATEAQLKRAYRLMSLKVHPDKAGGSAAAFHQVAEAFETLSDPEKRQLYDDGVDTNKKRKKKEKGPYDSDSSESEDEDGNKKKSLREEVERRYFPDHFQFWPFGDPFVNKRRHQQRKKKQAEQEKARKERMKARANHQTPSHPWWQGHSDWDI